MSGLAPFFRHPTEYSYHTSLATLPSSSSTEASLSVIHQSDNSNTRAANHQEPQQLERPLFYDEWKRSRKQFLAAYLQNRLMVPMAATEAADDNHNEDQLETKQQERKETEHAMENEQEQPQEEEALETQPEFVVTHQTDEDPNTGIEAQNTHTNNTSKLHPPPDTINDNDDDDESHRTPHVTAALHSVHYLNDLDLLTRDLTLDVLHVPKIWKLRDIRRCKRPTTTSQHLYTAHAPQLPRLALAHYHDDGPMLSCYQQVLSVEVTQANLPNILRQRIPSSLRQHQTNQRRRLTIFFYNAYARAMHTILFNNNSNNRRRKNEGKQLYLSLQNVPAKCIVPYARQDWLDQMDLVPYCIVLGDDCANLKVTGPDEDEDLHMRFDDRDLRLYVRVESMSNKLTTAATTAATDTTTDATVHCIMGDRHEGVLLRTVDVEASPFGDYFQNQDGASNNNSNNNTAPLLPRKNRPEATLVTSPQSKRHKPTTSADPPTAGAALPAPPTVHNHRGPEFTYTTFNEFRQTYEMHRSVAQNFRDPCFINVFAVVMSFKPPFQTTRGDWMMGIGLVDDTLPLGPDEPLRIVGMNLFTKTKEALPQVRSAGDVLRMHRVKLQEWNGEMQLMGMRASSYVVCRGHVRGDGGDGEESLDWTYASTAEKSDFAPTEDQGRFEGLWKWAQQRLLEYPTMKEDTSMKISDMTSTHNENNILLPEGDKPSGDLTVMVGSILPNPQGSLSSYAPCGILRVWDGTGYSESDPLPLQWQEVHPDFLNTTPDPTEEALVKIADIVGEVGITGIEPPKGLTGRVVNLVIWEKSHWDLIHQSQLTPGSFIRLRNVKEDALVDDTIRCLMVQRLTYLTPLPNRTYEVVQILRAHNDRIQRKDAWNPSCGFLPLRLIGSPAHAARLTSAAADGPKLKDLITATSTPSTFMGTVELVDLIPSLNSLSFTGVSPILSNSGFRVGARLQDHSGTFDAILEPMVAEDLVKMSPAAAGTDPKQALQNLDQVRGTWEARIRSTSYLGSTYLVVESLQK